MDGLKDGEIEGLWLGEVDGETEGEVEGDEPPPPLAVKTKLLT